MPFPLLLRASSGNCEDHALTPMNGISAFRRFFSCKKQEKNLQGTKKGRVTSRDYGIIH